TPSLLLSLLPGLFLPPQSFRKNAYNPGETAKKWAVGRGSGGGRGDSSCAAFARTYGDPASVGRGWDCSSPIISWSSTVADAKCTCGPQAFKNPPLSPHAPAAG